MAVADRPFDRPSGRRAAAETYPRARRIADRVFTGLSIGLLVALAALQLIPLYWMVTTSIKLPEGILSVPPQWIPYPVSFHAWKRLLEDEFATRWFVNTLFVAGTVTMGNLVLASLAGYTFAKLRFPGQNLFFWAIIATMTLPGQLVAIPLYRMVVVEFQWHNTYRALIVPSVGSAFFIFLMRQFLATLPYSLTDAARIDGCSEFGIYWKIVLPLAIPALAVLCIFTFIGQWNSFFWPLLMTRTPDMLMLQVGLTWLRFGSLDYGMLMAGATASAMPVVIVFLVLQRYFLTGLTLGAIKG